MQFLGALDTCLKTLQGLYIGKLVGYLSSLEDVAESDMDHSEGTQTLSILCVICLLIICSHHTFWFWGYRLGARAKIGLIGLIYRKLLRISFTKLHPGDVTTLIAVDCVKMEMGLWTTPFLWIAPVLTGVVLYFLSGLIGWAGPVGVLFIVLTIPVQGIMSMQGVKSRRAATEFTAKRTGIVHEVISGVRMMKMFAWERYTSFLKPTFYITYIYIYI